MYHPDDEQRDLEPLFETIVNTVPAPLVDTEAPLQLLVAALDYVKRRAAGAQVDRFKQHGIFGVEQESGVVALAVVNMIFRGDGKNNIREGNCFATFLAPPSRWLKDSGRMFGSALNTTRLRWRVSMSFVCWHSWRCLPIFSPTISPTI